MEVHINQQVIVISENTPLQDVLHQQGFHAPKGIAVAINDTVVSSDGWHNYILQPEDKIMIIRATQGG